MDKDEMRQPPGVVYARPIEGLAGELARLLQDTLRTLSLDCGRVLLQPLDMDAPLVCCATRDAVQSPTLQHDWLERQVMVQRGGMQVIADTPVAYFAGAHGAGIHYLACAPIMGGEMAIGAISVAGARRPAAASVLQDLNAACDCISSLLSSLDDGESIAVPASVQSLLAVLPWAVLLVDRSRNLLHLNPAAARLSGCPLSEVRGLKLERLLHCETFPAENTCEAAMLTPLAGEQVSVEVCAAGMHLPGGESVTAVMLRPMLQQPPQLEEQLRMAELEGIVRTVATVNHEINNPLFGIMATIQVLRDELKDASPSICRKLDRINICCERIEQITDDLSRIIRPTRRTYAAEEGMLDLERATDGYRTIPPSGPLRPSRCEHEPRPDHRPSTRGK